MFVPPKRRGRKPKSAVVNLDGPAIENGGDIRDGDGPSSDDLTDPAALTRAALDGTGSDDTGDGDAGTGTGPRKRRAYKARAAKKAMDITGIEKLLYSTHTMLSAFVVPELAIDQQEAAMLANGIAQVQRHYTTSEFSEKTFDWLNLVGVCGMVYGTRFMAVRARMQAEARDSRRSAVTNPPKEAPRANTSTTATGPGSVTIPGVGSVTFPGGLN